MEFPITGLGFSEKFLKELTKLDPGIQTAARDALLLLQTNPSAKTLRLHRLTGFARPSLWKIDVFSNKSYQITFEMEGAVAHLKRIATHAQLDRNPRG
ncbi:MAG: hypothetical protein LBH10_02255 [Burkholderiaceae bacterium]|nr:hypothetical protein [Burkholderiaceae bacterium]